MIIEIVCNIGGPLLYFILLKWVSLSPQFRRSVKSPHPHRVAAELSISNCVFCKCKM